MFPVHRCILAARCDFFRGLFFSGMTETSGRRAVLREVTAAGMEFVLRYLYGEEVSPPPPIAVEVLIAADVYSLVHLKKDAEAVVRRHIDRDNACTLLHLAYQHSAPLLLEAAVAAVAHGLERYEEDPDFLALPAEPVGLVREAAAQIRAVSSPSRPRRAKPGHSPPR